MTTTPTTQTVTDLDADRARIVSRLADLQATAAEIGSEVESLKAELRSLPAGDFAINGRPALRITATRRFDVEAGAALLSHDQREAAKVVTFDAAAIKRHLTEVEIEECMVVSGNPKVQVL